jgi:hypothetical protein
MVDEVVVRFNADSIWNDPQSIAQVVASVAGSRKNGPGLIEFMQKISDTRGYSAILLKIGEIDELMEGPLVECGFSDVITRVCKRPIDDPKRIRDLVVAEVGDFVRSGEFPVRAAVSELIQLMGAVMQRPDDEEGGGGGSQLGSSPIASEWAEISDCCMSLRKAVNEAAGFDFSAEAVAAAAEAIVTAHLSPEPEAEASVAPTLKALFEPVRSSLEMVKKAVDIARGFAELDSVCAGAPCASALELFSLRWGIFRGTAEPPEVDPFAAAIVELNLRELKELIGGRDPSGIEIEPEKLPLDMLRWKGKKSSLIGVAASVGDEPLRYLIGFHGQKPDAMALPQAVAFGDPETIRMVWDRSDEKERMSNPALIRLAIDFHHVEVARWLLQEQPLWLDLGRLFARATRAFDVLSRLPKGGDALPTLDSVSRVELNPNFDGAVVDAVKTKSTSWLTAALLAGGDPNGHATRRSERRVLGLAAKLGHDDCVRLLLQFGADPNQGGEDGTSALTEGAGYPRVVALLLENDANPNGARILGGDQPLLSAAHAKSVESVRLILANGGDLRRTGDTDVSVLHRALTNTNAECCRELLAHGADPCQEDGGFRETPMHVVAECASLHDDGPERVKILDVLLEAGASVLAVDRSGYTPGQVARRCGASKEVLEWFARHQVGLSV